MDLVRRSSGRDASFDLGGDVTIAEAAELRDALALALATSQHLTLNKLGNPPALPGDSPGLTV